MQQKKNDWNEILKGAKEGGRNNAAAKVCGYILTKVPMSQWEHIAWPAVKDWNRSNKPPLDEDELRLTFDSISGRVLFSQNDTEKELLSLTKLAEKHRNRQKEGNDKLVPTGFQVLDSYLNGGARPGDLILIGARPSVGKSSFALTLAYHAAKAGKSVIFFSIEMSSLSLYDRLLAMETGLSCSTIITGEANKKEVAKGYEELSKLKITVAELSKATSKDVEKIAQKFLLENPVDLIIVDYLQFLSDKETGGNSASRVGEISRNLKSLARSTNIPVISPSQLSRKVEEGGRSREPRLADLRDSGNLEQDADVVVLLHRNKDGTDREKVRVIVAKNRNGETGSLSLKFNLLTTRFEESD
jgi:replicative DNA helicase